MITEAKLMRTSNKMRCLFAIAYLDGHDRGVITVMSHLRDKGFEVIYIKFVDASEITNTAKQEDVDLIAVTSNIGEHLYVARRLLKALKDAELDIPVIMGGVIPTDDVPRLLEIGIKKVFGPGTGPPQVSEFISQYFLGEKVK